MRKLDRTKIAAPECLANYQHGRDNWSAVSGEDKSQIWEQLNELHDVRCAYCEGPLEKLGKHVEHFRDKHNHPTLTFEWENLFGSCNCCDRCGHYKDNGAGEYDPDNLINPCDDDPDDYFLFSSDGSIQVRDGLSEQQQLKANETLRVFNLDPQFGKLRATRENVARGYLAPDPSIIDALMDFEPEDARDYAIEELQKVQLDPFSTVIRHLFDGLI